MSCRSAEALCSPGSGVEQPLPVVYNLPTLPPYLIPVLIPTREGNT
jgi:hypothetical protein